MAKLVSKVYGDAYVSVVSDKNNLNVALDEIKAIKDIFVKNEDIALLLDSPKMDDEEKLAGFKKQADAILEDARKRAKDRENEIIEEARAEAMRITDRANNEIELAKKKAMEEVKSNIVDVASIIASKAVNSEMNVEVQDRLVEETLKEIGDGTWQN